MFKTIALTLAIASPVAFGLKVETKTIPMFIDASGKQVAPLEAAAASMSGKKVFKCEQVEAIGKDNGSITMKKVK